MVGVVVGFRVAGGVRLVVGLLTGVVVAVGLLLAGFVVGVVLGRLVVPPPIVPPPVAGSCCAIATLAEASRHTKAEREIRESRHRVDMRFSPAVFRQRCCCDIDAVEVGHYELLRAL